MPCPPLPRPNHPPTSPPHIPHPPNHFPSLNHSLTLSCPGPLLTNSAETNQSTQLPSGEFADHYASRFEPGKILTIRRKQPSLITSSTLKKGSRNMRKPFSGALRGTRSTLITQDSKSILALDCNVPSSGSSSLTKELSPASVMTMAQVLLPTSSRYIPSHMPLLNLSNHSHHGLKPSF